MLPILWRAEAQADLAAILEYIAERNPQFAFELYDGIERVVSQLPHHPYLYRLGRVPGTANSSFTPITLSYLIMFVRQNSAIPAESNLSEWLSY